MNNIKFLFYLSFCGLLLSCGYSEEFAEVNHENRFIISYPDYMKPSDDLSAEFQYKNAYRNTYSIINSQDKNGKTLADFQKESLNLLKSYELLSKPLVTDSSYRETPDFKAIDVKLYGIIDGENIYYWHSAFESKGKFFEVVCWTRSMDRKQRYGPDLEKIIASFKPLA